MRKQKSKPFEEPDPFSTYQPAPISVKKFVLSKILPAKYVKSILVILGVLFISPIMLLLFDPSILEDTNILTPVITTICLLYVLFSILAGFVLLQNKNPYLQELKEKLGYIE